ncbi:unnamed protein product, partial [Porites evermanni]
TLGEQAEVAVAVLPLLLQTKAGACKHKEFVQFVLEETNPGSIAEGKDNLFPFLIFIGTLALPGKIYIAADKQIICSFEVSLVEAALALLATSCVFMYNYPPGLAKFYSFIQKCILHISDGKKLSSSLMSL